MFFYVTLAEGPGVARDKKCLKKFKKLFRMFFSPLHSPATPECPQKNFSPIGPAVWSAIINLQYILVLFYLYGALSIVSS